MYYLKVQVTCNQKSGALCFWPLILWLWGKGAGQSTKTWPAPPQLHPRIVAVLGWKTIQDTHTVPQWMPLSHGSPINEHPTIWEGLFIQNLQEPEHVPPGRLSYPQWLAHEIHKTVLWTQCLWHYLHSLPNLLVFDWCSLGIHWSHHPCHVSWPAGI